MTTRILIVEDDPWMLRVVRKSIERPSFVFDTAEEGTIALVKALANPPDLVISDVVMPGMNGWTLVRRMRAHYELAFVPFIFITVLTSLDDMLRGFQFGADDYIAKPFRPQDLEARVLNVLRRRELLVVGVREHLRQEDPTIGHSMRGSLREVGLSSLLVLLEMERKTGRLVITRREGGERCRILLRDGRVVSAAIEQGGAQRNSDALFHGLSWTDGSFVFDCEPVDAEDELGVSTTYLLLEGARRLDEAMPGPGEA